MGSVFQKDRANAWEVQSDREGSVRDELLQTCRACDPDQATLICKMKRPCKSADLLQDDDTSC